jgi:hypothetical protein
LYVSQTFFASELMKRFAGFILFLFVSVTTILGALELGLVYVLNNPESCPDALYAPLRQYYREFDQSIIQYEPTLAKYDSALFYTLKPGIGRFSNREFDNQFLINSAGLRDDEQSLVAPEIIVLGDSYTMGWGVDQDSTYPQILKRELGISVLNSGISSYGTAREFGMLNRINTDSLKVLIIQYCPNDLIENINYIENGNSLQLSPPETWHRLVSEKKERKKYYPFKHLFTVSKSMKRYSKVDDQFETRKKESATPKIGTAEAFLSILRDSDKIPDDAMIIVFNVEAENVNNGFISLIKATLDGQFASALHDRVSYLDLTGKLDNSNRFIWDPHLNSSGHRTVANEILQHIQKLPNGYEKRFWTYETGDTSIVCDYYDGLKHGTYKAFWPNGNPSRVARFLRGSQVGEQLDYLEGGSPKTNGIRSTSY